MTNKDGSGKGQMAAWKVRVSFGFSVIALFLLLVELFLQSTDGVLWQLVCMRLIRVYHRLGKSLRSMRSAAGIMKTSLVPRMNPKRALPRPNQKRRRILKPRMPRSKEKTLLRNRRPTRERRQPERKSRSPKPQRNPRRLQPKAPARVLEWARSVLLLSRMKKRRLQPRSPRAARSDANAMILNRGLTYSCLMHSLSTHVQYHLNTNTGLKPGGPWLSVMEARLAR